MNKEEIKLLTMLKDNKISETDYQMLKLALNKQSFCTQVENSLLVNPFQKIAGFKALFLGLIVLVLISFGGVHADVYIEGLIGYLFADNVNAIKPSFFLLLYQNIVACLTLSVLFIVVSKIFKQKKFRILDFFGTVALARFPILTSLIFTILNKHFNPELFKFDYSKGIELHLSLTAILANFEMMIIWAWLLMTYLFSLKESSGLQGKKLWFGFLIAMVVGEGIAIILTRWPLYI